MSATTYVSLADHYTRCEFVWVKDHGDFNVLGYTWAKLSDGSRRILKNPVIGLPVKVLKHKPVILTDLESNVVIIKPWREEPFEIDYTELTKLF